MKTIGVIGAGSMGSGIAQIAASNGCKVLLYDNNSSALDLALEKLKKILTRLVEKGRIDNNQTGLMGSGPGLHFRRTPWV